MSAPECQGVLVAMRCHTVAKFAVDVQGLTLHACGIHLSPLLRHYLLAGETATVRKTEASS